MTCVLYGFLSLQLCVHDAGQVHCEVSDKEVGLLVDECDFGWMKANGNDSLGPLVYSKEVPRGHFCRPLVHMFRATLAVALLCGVRRCCGGWAVFIHKVSMFC